MDANFSKIKCILLVVTATAAFVDAAFADLKDSIPCGDWSPYKDAKCFKIVDKTGFQNQQDANIVCNAFAENSNQEFLPKLITIKTQEEQQYLQNMLFVENNVVDNVWIGLKEVNNSGLFSWSDGTEVLYSNWANQTLLDKEHRCVQMASGKGAHGVGLWIKVDCRVSSRVVCEKRQKWNVEMLYQMFSNHIQEFEKLKQKHEATEKEILVLKQNSVPKGFIYVQLSGQEPPTRLWPLSSWKDVSSAYAGLFFRVDGGKAAPFGQIQEESTKRLDQVQVSRNERDHSPITLPSNGSWSQTIHTGIYTNFQWIYSVKFHISSEEIRPRNQAVKVWQRI